MMGFTCTINFLMFIEIFLNSDQASEWNFIFLKNNLFFYKLINPIVLGKIRLPLIYNENTSFCFWGNESISKFVTILN